MPRLINKPPAYSLHKASGLAKVKYRGKITYLGKHGSKESLEAYARFIASIPKPVERPKAPELAPGTPLLVGEIVLKYYEFAQRYYAKNGVPTGEHVTVRSALRPLAKTFGELPAREFGPKRLKLLQEEMIKLGWTRRYINKATGIVKRCFSWCASEELIDIGTAMALRTVPGLLKDRTDAREKAPVGPVSDEHVEVVLPHISPLAGDAIRVMRLTGARPSEVLTMAVAAIDRSDPECWVYRLADHKTVHRGQERTIFLGPKTQEIILPRILKAGRDGRLFPMSRASLRTAVERGCRRAGIPTWNPNRIRHTVGTEVRSQFGLEAAQCLLGHTKADTTQVYAERNMKQARDVARKIG